MNQQIPTGESTLSDGWKTKPSPPEKGVMMTKKELCWMIVNEYCVKEHCSEPDVRDIMRSSTLAVAMLHLNMLKNKCDRDYARTRGGVIFVGNIKPPTEDKEFKTLSFAKVLSLLPD